MSGWIITLPVVTSSSKRSGAHVRGTEGHIVIIIEEEERLLKNK
jgi:hypothetical protein